MSDTYATPFRSPTTYRSAAQYPDSDGSLIAESDWHRRVLIDLLFMLETRYRDADDVYVAGHMFVYYEKGNPAAVFAPDVFVAFGVPKRLRRSFKLWEEPAAPTVVFEVSSKSTWMEDRGNKMALCERLGVEEYYICDPLAEYLEPPLQGHRLIDGRYEPIEPEPDGRLLREWLGLWLRREADHLELVEVGSGHRLLRPAEIEAARRTEEAARRVEEAARRAEEAARRAAEERSARLEAELDQLRRRLDGDDNQARD